MASSLNFAGNYTTTGYVLSNGSETVVYTVPSGKFAYVTQILATEIAGGARTITIKAVKGGTAYTMCFQYPIAANDTFSIELDPLVLSAGDTIKVTASAATVHVLVTCHEGSRHSS